MHAYTSTLETQYQVAEGHHHSDVMWKVDGILENVEHRLRRVKAEVDSLFGDLEAAKAGDTDALNRALVGILDLSRSAGASGPIQSSVAYLTAEAGKLQGIVENGLLREKRK